MDLSAVALEVWIDHALIATFKDAFEQVPWSVVGMPVDALRLRLQALQADDEPRPRAILGILGNADAEDVFAAYPELPAEVSILVVQQRTATPEWASRPDVAEIVGRRCSVAARTQALVRGALHAARRAQLKHIIVASTLRDRHLKELNRIGAALSTEHNLDRLLELIVSKARELTSADAGSLYLVEPSVDDGQPGTLFFKVAQNDTLNRDFSAFRMPINPQSIAGYVALKDEVLNLPDVYDLAASSPYTFNRSFDQQSGYRSQSMLVVPMSNHQGVITGVLQLINKKRHFDRQLRSLEIVHAEVRPFDDADVELVTSLAAQAGVAIENAQLYEAIQKQFESFIYASVSAIEQRDPTTAGHSERVATLTVGLAEAVDKIEQGALRAVRFSREQVQEIFYAGLLHDFGKIGVREHVLVKAKKLFGFQSQHIEDRFRLMRKALELKAVRSALDAYERDGVAAGRARRAAAEQEARQEIERLHAFLNIIRQANEPAVLPENARGELAEMIHMAVEDLDDGALPLLTPDEYRSLSIPKGSLTDDERLEIESHVTHTYRFLKLIPWTKELKNVAEIAYGHHEKLDGTGYPRGVPAERIPVQTRMMTISDIFDALTAQDRPYKRAVPLVRALDILKMEVDEGKLDRELYQIFIDAKVFERVPAGQQRP